MTVRVVQWATGPVGKAQLREVIDRPDLELVGLYVYSESKVGTDAGDMVGRPPTGITATNDTSAILALDADLVLHAASKAFPGNTNTEDIVALLTSGKTVITTTSYNHLATYDSNVETRIKQACAHSGARFHAAGEHPGFMFERLATSLTALSRRVDRITVQEFVDCRAISAREMLVDLMGMGKPPHEISPESPLFQSVSIQYEQSLAAAADVLGLRFDEIRKEVRTATLPYDVDVACATLPAGSVIGQIMSWSACSAGVPVLVAEEHWTAVAEIPSWNLALDGQFLIRVVIDGSPPIRLELTIDNQEIDLDGVAGGQLAVAMTAVRAIPYVLAAAPGVVVPNIFGAYRWPDTTAEKGTTDE
ncbi:dihydrodipicolinate synthase [Mycobacterium sp. CVI_P3]|uniref:Dihydrodipicolinate synthase n=1 Tax=Mycobacterium pinniadriaticum TaxID=2994102 RepID=A0ABT3SCG8_9MYCO|nr:dihydrodipicolinate synthase [Mycobacterium pinniadriaticum]MCX2930410.1 dihydrodipicolinate synthase [Mycobacterium pinniadriaticum]MCX2936834.1 dihydrodipicolinate synthase [Mycobacterium pinniadriaticum]